jgi:hypothetical protein
MRGLSFVMHAHPCNVCIPVRPIRTPASEVRPEIVVGDLSACWHVRGGALTETSLLRRPAFLPESSPQDLVSTPKTVLVVDAAIELVVLQQLDVDRSRGAYFRD